MRNGCTNVPTNVVGFRIARGAVTFPAHIPGIDRPPPRRDGRFIL